MSKDLRFLDEDICHFIFELLNEVTMWCVCFFDLENPAKFFKELFGQFFDDLHLGDDFQELLSF